MSAPYALLARRPTRGRAALEVARRTERLLDGVAVISFSMIAGEAPLLLTAPLVALVLRLLVDMAS